MLGIRKIAAGALSEAGAYTAHLLEQTLPTSDAALAAYYLRDKSIAEGLADGMRSVPLIRADIDPAVARALDLKPGGFVSEKQLQAILSGRKADGAVIERGQKKGKRYKATKAGEADRFDVSAFDFCFSAPKSVSVAWVFAGDAERNSILKAHDDAVATTLAHFEYEVGKARRGSGGSKGHENGKLAWIRINHFTARPTFSIKRRDKQTGVMGTELYTVRPDVAGDPQLHSHCIVPNVLVTDTGRTVSISQNLFYDRKKEFGAFYQAALAQNLRRMGVEVELCDKHHLAKISAIPEAVCEAFSKRTRDAKGAAIKEAEARGLDWGEMDDDARVAFLKGGAKASRAWKVDDLANVEDWHRQAKDIGFEHATAVTSAPAEVPDDRIDKAVHIARGYLAERLENNAVISGTEIRTDAIRGLISAGFNAAADVSAVTRRLAQEGVLQDGQRTHLMWVETALGKVKITTALHKEQEEDVIRLVREAADDRSRALTLEEVSASAAGADIRFEGEHGAQQRHAMETLATGGAFSLVIGCAGAGKSTLFRPIVDSYRAKGRKVWGVAQGWVQADALKDAGIDGLKTRALAPFLDGIEQGRTKIDANSVLILDEISKVGTLELLRLMRLREQYGFQVIAAGDDRQCGSIQAGAVIDLLHKALGPGVVPEIALTVRQKSEREKEIAGLFRESTPESVGNAIAMKCDDGTAELVDGGYEEAVERIAEMALEKGATVSAPTNADALAIGRAMRRRRGLAGGRQVRATNGHGDAYDLELTAGDKVRLFKRTTARFATNNSSIGNNGSVLEIVAVDDTGLTMKTATGNVGFVPWSRLMHGERVLLAYGDCLTVDSAQGSTSDYHIFGAPGGTGSVGGARAYVASTRHRITSWLVTSKGEEMRGVQESRPLGVADPITDEAIWAQVARNLARQTIKENATDVLAAVAESEIKTARGFQAGMRAIEGRRQGGRPGTAIRRRIGYARLSRHFTAAASVVRKALITLAS